MINLKQIDQDERIDNVQRMLDKIDAKLGGEFAFKQKLIERQDSEIHSLQTSLQDRQVQCDELRGKLERCAKETEGSRQLINKLLNDIERLQQDIEWYKRTYEKRSFLGMIKEKFMRRRG